MVCWMRGCAAVLEQPRYASGEQILNRSTAQEIVRTTKIGVHEVNAIVVRHTWSFRIKGECSMEMRKLKSEKVPGEAFVRSNEASTTARTDNSWQDEAALFLLRSGFRPGDAMGEVQHVANPHSVGRTFGSVWHAMRSLVESEPERSAGAAQDEAHTQPPQ